LRPAATGAGDQPDRPIIMSRTIARAWASLIGLGTIWMKPRRRAILRARIGEALAPSVTVAIPGGTLRFYTPTARSLYDPWSLYEGEPETARWLDTIGPGEVLWDIGANVGIYALYAAKARGLRVLAFEPSASTYAILVRNIELNGAAGQVDAYCLAFDATNHLDYLHMANTEGGHSMHAFGRDQSIFGPIATVFRQSVIGFTIDGFCDLFAPPPPMHIKLDVDSIELEILKGATRTLTTHVRSVMVEVVQSRDEHEVGDTGAIGAFLTTLGFVEDTAFMAQGAKRNALFRRPG
jgi:FkbM family methyltransferase